MKLLHIFFMPILLIVVVACNKIEKTDDPVNYPAAYVINGESNSISIINLETEELVQSCKFKKGAWPHHISMNASGDKLLVSLVGSDLSEGHGGHAGHGAEDPYLMLLRAEDLKVLACTKLDAMAHNAIFMNGGEEIWVPQMEDEGTILRLDAESLKEKGSIAVGAMPLELTQDVNGLYAFAANSASNSISVINTQSGEVIKTINVGMEPVGAWPAANEKMYVDCELSKEIYEIDAVLLTVTDTISLNYTPAYVAYDDLNYKLWVSDAQNGGVHKYQLVGSNWEEEAYLATGANAHAITFSADYTKAYITNQDAANVSVIDVNSFSKLKDITVQQKPNGILLLY